MASLRRHVTVSPSEKVAYDVLTYVLPGSFTNKGDQISLTAK